MKRTIYTLALAMLLAGIVHILIILLIPNYAAKDAWTRLAQVAKPWEFKLVSIPGHEESVLPSVDPAFGMAACRYDLAQAPLRVIAEGHLPFWSVAIFDRQGRNIYSLNDRTAVERQLSLLVVNPVQMAQFRKNPPPESESAVLVETAAERGFVIVRALQESPGWSGEVMNFLTTARCEQLIQNGGQESGN